MPYVNATEHQGAFYVFVDSSEALEKNIKKKKVATTNRLADILINDYNVAVVQCMDFGTADAFDSLIQLP